MTPLSKNVSKPKSGLKELIRRFGPWLICLTIFYSLFRQIQPSAVLEAMHHAHVLLFVFYSLLYFLLVWILDCFALKHFISRFSTPVTFREIFLVRGISYLLMVINYPLSQGALALYLKKTHGASVAKTLGTVGFTMMADLLLVVTSGLLALSFTHVEFQGIDFNEVAFRFVPVMYAAFFVWIWIWKKTDQGVLKTLKKYRLINWVLSHDVFLIFREASTKDYLILFIHRAPLLIIVLAGYNYALFSFQAELEWSTLFLFNPIIMLVSTLPITPAGLGTGQYLTLLFFQNSVQSHLIVSKILNSEQVLFASSLLWGIINQVYKVIFGALCLLKSPKKNFAGSLSNELSRDFPPK